MSAALHVGVQIRPNHTSWSGMRAAWMQAETLGADSVYAFDHFYPIDEDRPEGSSFECWSTLAAMAEATRRVRLGSLVSCYAYRNPDLLADIARTVDHASGGRLVLGLGAGWHEPDYLAYGFPLLRAADRIRELDVALHRIKRRLAQLDPAPVGAMPILVGGLGERLTLPVVARHADEWNAWGSVDEFARLNRRLDECCEQAGRDPAAVRRTVAVFDVPSDATADDYVAAGAAELILVRNGPMFGVEDVVPMLRWRDARNREGAT